MPCRSPDHTLRSHVTEADQKLTTLALMSHVQLCWVAATLTTLGILWRDSPRRGSSSCVRLEGFSTTNMLVVGPVTAPKIAAGRLQVSEGTWRSIGA